MSAEAGTSDNALFARDSQTIGNSHGDDTTTRNDGLESVDPQTNIINGDNGSRKDENVYKDNMEVGDEDVHGEVVNMRTSLDNRMNNSRGSYSSNVKEEATSDTVTDVNVSDDGGVTVDAIVGDGKYNNVEVNGYEHINDHISRNSIGEEAAGNSVDSHVERSGNIAEGDGTNANYNIEAVSVNKCVDTERDTVSRCKSDQGAGTGVTIYDDSRRASVGANEEGSVIKDESCSANSANIDDRNKEANFNVDEQSKGTDIDKNDISEDGAIMTGNGSETAGYGSNETAILFRDDNSKRDEKQTNRSDLVDTDDKSDVGQSSERNEPEINDRNEDIAEKCDDREEFGESGMHTSSDSSLSHTLFHEDAGNTTHEGLTENSRSISMPSDLESKSPQELEVSESKGELVSQQQEVWTKSSEVHMERKSVKDENYTDRSSQGEGHEGRTPSPAPQVNEAIGTLYFDDKWTAGSKRHSPESLEIQTDDKSPYENQLEYESSQTINANDKNGKPIFTEQTDEQVERSPVSQDNTSSQDSEREMPKKKGRRNKDATAPNRLNTTGSQPSGSNQQSQDPTNQQSQDPTNQQSQDPTNQQSQDPTNQQSQDPTNQQSQDPTNQQKMDIHGDEATQSGDLESADKTAAQDDRRDDDNTLNEQKEEPITENPQGVDTLSHKGKTVTDSNTASVGASNSGEAAKSLSESNSTGKANSEEDHVYDNEESDRSKDPDSQKEVDSSSKPKKSKKRKVRTLKNLLQRDIKQQITDHLYTENRLNAFDNKAKRVPADSHIALLTDRRTDSSKSADSKHKKAKKPALSEKRLTNLAMGALDSVDVSEIWKFHQFRIGKNLDRTPNNGYVHNYSRHIGSILHSTQYKEFYDNLQTKHTKDPSAGTA